MFVPRSRRRRFSLAGALALSLATTVGSAAAASPTPSAGGMRMLQPADQSNAPAAGGASPSAAQPPQVAAGQQPPSLQATKTQPPAPSPSPTAGAPQAAAAGQPQGSPTPVGNLRRLGPAGEPAAASTTPQATATPTATPSPPPTETETPTPTPTPLVLPVFEPVDGAVRGGVDGTRLLLEVPIRSQFDGTEYQRSNCGPTSLAMVLDAFGVRSQTDKLRNFANKLQGNFDVEAGTSLYDLSAIANEAGLRAIGLNRSWTVAEVRDEVRHGHPVITLVKMVDLPDHATSLSATDHYVVVVGLDGEDLLVNDPALPGALGYRRPLTPTELEKGWADSSVPHHGAAFAAAGRIVELDLPDPIVPTATPVPTMVEVEPTQVPTWAPGVDPNPPPAPADDVAATADVTTTPTEVPLNPDQVARPADRPDAFDKLVRHQGGESPAAEVLGDTILPLHHATGPLFPLQLYVPRQAPWLARPIRRSRRTR